MTNDTESSQSIYSSGDVATILKIQESTLRKYCIMLEKAGYKIHKNEHGHRGFYDKDVITLKKLLEIKKHPDMTLEQACNAVISWIRESGGTKHDTTDISPYNQHNTSDDDNSIGQFRKEFQEYQKQQEVFQKELINQLNKQNEYIKNSLNERDERLLNAIKQSMEHRQQIAAAKEEKEENTNKKKWYKFW
ncbi:MULTISPECIES: hypothetical protein [Bacillota]|uniref:hypothetical protein n=1 Tax=Bacillota TaxID=1239 RepID=UPI0039EE37CA